MAKSEEDEEVFDPYDAEVLAANGIEYEPSTVRMWIKSCMYRTKLNGNLSVDRMAPPPNGVIRHLDLMEKGWGWRRLLPMYRIAGVDMPLYKEYLCEYYIRNPPESVDGGGAASDVERLVVTRSAWTNENRRLVPLACRCIEMEERFMARCKRDYRELTDGEIDLSKKIKLRAREVINGDGEYVGAYAAAAALVCITKEARLMREWVINGQYSSSDPDCILSNQIREHALSLMLHRGSGSVAANAGAAMVGAAKEAKLLCQCLTEDLFPDVGLCDEIREEACAVLRDLCKEASSAAADDGAEKSAPRLNIIGKKEKKQHKDSKLGEKGKRASAATDSQGVTPTQNTHATTGRRDLTARDNLDRGRCKDTTPVRDRAPTPPPGPETTVVTTETKIDMILTMITGMAEDIGIVEERQEKMWRQQERNIGRDKKIESEVSLGAVLPPGRSESGELHVTTPLHGSPRSLDDTEFTMVDFDFGDDRTRLESSFSNTAAPPSRQTYASASAPSASGVDPDEWIWVT